MLDMSEWRFRIMKLVCDSIKLHQESCFSVYTWNKNDRGDENAKFLTFIEKEKNKK